MTWGGRRSGAGAHPKPAVTAEEWAAVEHLLVGVGVSRRHGMGYSAAARLISQRRVGSRVDAQTVKRLAVSSAWLRSQHLLRIKTKENQVGNGGEHFMVNQDNTAYAGPRMDRDEAALKLGRFVKEGQASIIEGGAP